MKLVIFGLSISSAWGNGHATLWRGLCRELAAQGHRVVFFERDTPYYATNRDYFDIPGGRLVLYDEWLDVRGQAQQELRDADVGMVTSYCPDGVAATELVQAAPVAVRSFYDLDAPVTLARLRAGETVDYLGPRGLMDFDIVFSYTGGETLRELRGRLGAKRVEPLYGSVDPHVHQPAAPQPQYQADLSYLGTHAADRQESLASLFLAPARTMSHARFLIGGSQYPADFPWATNIHYVRHVPPPEHPSFYCSSRMTLNVTRRDMALAGFCPSGRLFEAAACGTPMLSDYWYGLDEFFVPGKEILIGSTPQDTIDALSLTDAELRQIARSAREMVLTEHTAARRAEELVDHLQAVSAPYAHVGSAGSER